MKGINLRRRADRKKKGTEPMKVVFRLFRADYASTTPLATNLLIKKNLYKVPIMGIFYICIRLLANEENNCKKYFKKILGIKY